VDGSAAADRSTSTNDAMSVRHDFRRRREANAAICDDDEEDRADENCVP
jgi:hypothetical protein